MAVSNFLKEFRSFAERGNAIDMAIGIIVGSVMTSVVNSLVKDVIMPPIGLLIGGVDFSQWFFVLAGGDGQTFNTIAEAQAAGATTLNLGVFLNTVISFIITMFAAFLIVRTVNKMKSKKAVTTTTCPYCKQSVDITATKCPHCCSSLTPGEVKPAEESDLNKGIKKLKKIVKIKK
ncbi:MAG: large conductance mechanosensitive channel protein MscL [Alphaproteobacteria bacterium]|nr:large conductance mechanosensitive channel protein MscL [Alphaproteobacteria bacterium]